MPSTRRLAVAGLLVALALGAAWAGGAFDRRPPSDPAAERLANRTAAATADVPAYSFTVGGSVVVERGDERRTAAYDGRGAFNRSERAYRIEIALGEAGGGFDADSETRFVRGHTLYTPCPYSRYVNVEDVSYATALPENRSWTAYTMLGGQRRLFGVSRVYDRGTDTVDGERARVVEVVPDRSKLSSLSAGVPGDDEVRRTNAGAGNLHATLYLAPDSALPLRVVVERERGGGFGGPTVRERIIYDFDYGPTTVEPPERTVRSEDACPRP
ncbi:hypothetical protein SAMN04487947_1178 [Halogeometricum rufum]|uniref:Uncharacterized protein n=1 Tax=Halogeometricum rufum TaxID=553469 RepID=A0A1I6GHX4_9EURY|nr:hypothetical protein [Halogeometricum rufum]SFR41749.1 hypothetical protein SAMN04487947_1178 [Halogeometricum rufum]